jgi:hypothetical protein
LIKNKNAAISGFSIDETGRIQSTFNMVSYLKVAPRDMKFKKKRYEKVSEDDEEEELDDEQSLSEKEIYSTHWPIARTIFSTMSVTGRIALEQQEDGSELLLQISKIDVSKIDMFRGDAASDEYMNTPEAQKKVKQNDPDEDFDEDESESDDDDEENAGKTQEGGLIQALINIQLQPRLKNILPNIR